MEEYNRTHCESELVVDNVDSTEKNELMINLQNIRFLNKHGFDIGCDKRLERRGIICLTETQPQHNFFPPKLDMFEDISIESNSSRYKFQSIAFCFRDDFDVIFHSRLISASLVSFSKSTLRSKVIQVLLLHFAVGSNSLFLVIMLKLF